MKNSKQPKTWVRAVNGSIALALLVFLIVIYLPTLEAFNVHRADLGTLRGFRGRTGLLLAAHPTVCNREDNMNYKIIRCKLNCFLKCRNRLLKMPRISESHPIIAI